MEPLLWVDDRERIGPESENQVKGVGGGGWFWGADGGGGWGGRWLGGGGGGWEVGGETTCWQ